MAVEYSLIIPTYNNPNGLLKVVQTVLPVIQAIGVFEWVIVDDGSTLDTQNVIRQIQNDYPHLPITFARHAQKRGQHHAIQTGLTHAKGAWILTLDDDSEVDPSSVLTLIKTQKDKDWDVVYGLYETSPKLVWRQVLSRIGHFFCVWLLRVHVPKGSSFRLFRRHLIPPKWLKPKSCFFLEVVLWKTTGSYGAIEVRSQKNETSKSRTTFWSILRQAYDIMGCFIKKRREPIE